MTFLINYHFTERFTASFDVSNIFSWRFIIYHIEMFTLGDRGRLVLNGIN